MADTVENPESRPVIPYASPRVRRRSWWWLLGLGAGGVIVSLVVLAALVSRRAMMAERLAAQRAAAAAVAASASARTAAAANSEVYFSPDGGATDAVVRELSRAQRSVRVQAYSFTSAPIAGGRRRDGPRCRGRRRARQEPGVGALHVGHVPAQPRRAGVHRRQARDSAQQGHPHRGNTVITGSFNFTKAAEERNAENLLILRGAADLAEQYRANFEAHVAHSRAYTR